MIFHGGVKYSTEVLKFSTKVLNIPWRCLNISWRYEIFKGGGYMSHRGMKYSADGVKYCTEVSQPQNISYLRGIFDPLLGIFHTPVEH